MNHRSDCLLSRWVKESIEFSEDKHIVVTFVLECNILSRLRSHILEIEHFKEVNKLVTNYRSGDN